MEPRLSQQQSQKLILSPQLMQYLRLLQMPAMELTQAVNEELAANPLLEETTQVESNEIDETQEPAEPEDRQSSTDELNSNDQTEHLPGPEDPLWQNFEDEAVFLRHPRDLQAQRDYQESLLTRPETLSDYILWQIRFLNLDEEETRVASEIIGNINEQGFLAATLEEIASAAGCGTDKAGEVLKKIQTLEPPGVAARNLRETLLIQLDRKGDEARLAREIIQNHFELLQRRNWPLVAKACGASSDEVARAAELITRLEPRPGRSFYPEDRTAVTPDAVISQAEDGDGTLKVEIIDEKVPELRIHPYYRRLLRTRDLDAGTRAFLKGKLQDAINFINAIKQRKSTLRLITDQIVADQGDFFTGGFAHLKPMRLKDISDKLGIHESTVSRAIHGKYVQTPQGTVPYRSFFSSRLESSSGEDESQKSMLEKIRQIIAQESPRDPLSDQEIVEKFRAEGIKIARRTVAKYRDLLKILPSHLRRQHLADS